MKNVSGSRENSVNRFFLNAFIDSAERNGKRIDNDVLKSIV